MIQRYQFQWAAHVYRQNWACLLTRSDYILSQTSRPSLSHVYREMPWKSFSVCPTPLFITTLKLPEALPKTLAWVPLWYHALSWHTAAKNPRGLQGHKAHAVGQYFLQGSPYCQRPTKCGTAFACLSLVPCPQREPQNIKPEVRRASQPCKLLCSVRDNKTTNGQTFAPCVSHGSFVLHLSRWDG